MLNMMSSQRARGLGHRAFYLHPEGSPGTGGTPSGNSENGDENLEAIPESAERKTGASPDGDTSAPTEQ